jgi:transposase-like protein
MVDDIVRNMLSTPEQNCIAFGVGPLGRTGRRYRIDRRAVLSKEGSPWPSTAHSIEFKRQVAQEFLAGETLHGLSKRHDICRNLIRVWVQKYEAGALNEDVQALVAERGTCFSFTRSGQGPLFAHLKRLDDVSNRRQAAIAVAKNRPKRLIERARQGGSRHERGALSVRYSLRQQQPRSHKRGRFLKNIR